MAVSQARLQKFGKRLRSERLARFLTQEELGEKLGVGRVTVARWEAGRQEPTLAARLGLMQLFGVGIDRLFE